MQLCSTRIGSSRSTKVSYQRGGHIVVVVVARDGGVVGRKRDGEGERKRSVDCQTGQQTSDVAYEPAQEL